MKVDVLVDVQWGDCGKGKISKHLNDYYKYDAIIKYNGGGNAGHAVWLGDEKYTAHYLTSGMYSEKTHIIIGPGCVLNPTEFLNEYNQFKDKFKLENRVFIHPYTHIITLDHLLEDAKDSKIGTTKKGIGPAYAGKYARTNKRAEEIEELKPFLLQSENIMKLHYRNILMEGSQGWWLDIDYGKYPYVTSSHIHPGFAFATFGIPIYYSDGVIGVAKIYETYVGNADDIVRCDEKDEELIRYTGGEYGETTGRARKIGYLNLNKLHDACLQCGVDELYINKCDILEKVGIFKLYLDDNLITFENMDEMKKFIKNHLKLKMGLNDIIFSGDKNGNDL
ncbi:MAG: adenylosuccinate synthetase [bacterium]